MNISREHELIDIKTFEIGKLQLEDGDILLVKFPDGTTKESQYNIELCVEKTLQRADIKAITLLYPDNVSFQIVKPPK